MKNGSNIKQFWANHNCWTLIHLWLLAKKSSQDWFHQHPVIEDLDHRSHTIPWRFKYSRWVKGGREVFCNDIAMSVVKKKILLWTNHCFPVNNNNESHAGIYMCTYECTLIPPSHTQYTPNQTNTQRLEDKRGVSWEWKGISRGGKWKKQGNGQSEYIKYRHGDIKMKSIIIYNEHTLIKYDVSTVKDSLEAGVVAEWLLACVRSWVPFSALKMAKQPIISWSDSMQGRKYSLSKCCGSLRFHIGKLNCVLETWIQVSVEKLMVAVVQLSRPLYNAHTGWCSAFSKHRFSVLFLPLAWDRCYSSLSL